MIGYMFRTLAGKSAIQKKLKQHFRSLRLEEIATTARTFPLASRVDVQLALNYYFAGRKDWALLGIHSAIGHETPTLAHLFTRFPFPVAPGPENYALTDIRCPSRTRTVAIRP